MFKFDLSSFVIGLIVVCLLAFVLSRQRACNRGGRENGHRLRLQFFGIGARLQIRRRQEGFRFRTARHAQAFDFHHVAVLRVFDEQIDLMPRETFLQLDAPTVATPSSRATWLTRYRRAPRREISRR